MNIKFYIDKKSRLILRFLLYILKVKLNYYLIVL